MEATGDLSLALSPHEISYFLQLPDPAARTLGRGAPERGRRSDFLPEANLEKNSRRATCNRFSGGGMCTPTGERAAMGARRLLNLLTISL
jgi:hypothetical protein